MVLDFKYIFNTNNGGLISTNPDGYTDEEKEYLIKNKFWVEDNTDEVSELEQEVNKNIWQGLDSLELTIALTNHCNFRCVYCYQDKNEQKMSLDVADKILDKIDRMLQYKRYEVIKIHYFGGEPLLNIPILCYLDEKITALSKKYQILYQAYLTTNGSMLTDELMSKVHFYSIQLTFDGMKNTHNSLRVSDSFHFDDEVQLIGRIMEHSDARIILRMNICKQNQEEIIALHRYVFDKYGWDRIEINPNRMIKYHEKDQFDMLSPKEYAEILFRLKVFMDKATGTYKLPIPRITPCKFPTGNAYAISPKGLCAFCSGEMNGGNTYFWDIDVNKKKEIRFRDECKKCVCLPLCLGGCIVQYRLNAGCCTHHKYEMKEILTYYIEKLQSK